MEGTAESRPNPNRRLLEQIHGSSSPDLSEEEEDDDGLLDSDSASESELYRKRMQPPSRRPRYQGVIALLSHTGSAFSNLDDDDDASTANTDHIRRHRNLLPPPIPIPVPVPKLKLSGHRHDRSSAFSDSSGNGNSSRDDRRCNPNSTASCCSDGRSAAGSSREAATSGYSADAESSSAARSSGLHRRPRFGNPNPSVSCQTQADAGDAATSQAAGRSGPLKAALMFGPLSALLITWMAIFYFYYLNHYKISANPTAPLS